MKIAVDAMGGDFGPPVIVEGAVAAAREGAKVILVGDSDTISAELASYDVKGLAVEIKHASEVVEMDESPAHAIRNKKDSSIRVCFDAVKNGDASAVVSAGNSGALLAAGMFVLKRLKGVERPAIAVPLPTIKDPAVIIDAGANVDCKPLHLAHFAVMGAAYSKDVLKKENPTVGLLSNAAEEGKGTELTKLANELIKTLGLNYVGYIEGKDVFKGEVDVVVTDGFVGNVVLKVSEGIVEAVFKMLKREIEASLPAKLGYVLSKGAFRNLKSHLDYAEYGGAPLLGVDGSSIICHGGSTAKAIKNAIFTAGTLAEAKVGEHIVRELADNNELEKLALRQLL